MMKPISDEDFLRALRDDFPSAMGTLPESVTQEYHVHFADAEDGSPLRADLYYRDRKPPRTRPALIFLHDWASGKHPVFCGERQAAYLALKENVFFVVLYYRQPMEARFPAALHDLKCCVRWIRSIAEEYAVDPAAIVAMGSSAGTQWAGLAAATNGVADYEGADSFREYSSDVNLAVLKSGIYDLFGFAEGSAIAQIMGGTREEMPERYREGSLLHRVRAGMPPVLIIHGDKDETCPVKAAVATCERLQSLGIASELVVLEGRGHALREEDFIPVLDRAAGFIREHLSHGAS